MKNAYIKAGNIDVEDVIKWILFPLMLFGSLFILTSYQGYDGFWQIKASLMFLVFLLMVGFLGTVNGIYKTIEKILALRQYNKEQSITNGSES